ncbi:ribosome recycling factor [bacterium DOLZORAL124_38_8]|nr:MAG: ribosome recycling factor [bacterium DOLZORAL124_38_8]
MITTLQQELKKAIEHLKSQFSSLQAGRANTALVDEIQVESYGAMMSLKSTANVSCPDAKTIRIEPWDKSLLGEIEKAIQSSNIGINPQNMGEYILLPIPPMTEDRRKQLVKVVHEEAEKTRITIRNKRADSRDMVKLQKDEKEISEDEAKKLETDIQEVINEANKEVDTLTKKKEEEILNI